MQGFLSFRLREFDVVEGEIAIVIVTLHASAVFVSPVSNPTLHPEGRPLPLAHQRVDRHHDPERFPQTAAPARIPRRTDAAFRCGSSARQEHHDE